MQIDHMKPQYLDGTDDLENLLPSCRSCNCYKGTHTIELFRRNIEKLPEKLDIYNSTYRIAKRYGNVIENKKPIIFYFERDDENDK